MDFPFDVAFDVDATQERVFQVIGVQVVDHVGDGWGSASRSILCPRFAEPVVRGGATYSVSWRLLVPERLSASRDRVLQEASQKTASS